MDLNFLRDKRINKDIKNYIKSDLNSLGIYCYWDDSDMSNIKALIIGPPDTPYEGGFYFFDITFPNNYPYSPPHVKFLTYVDNIRFNPNLYVNGKVCLSILGTWAGPGWSSCLSLNSVLVSIQSLLNEQPIQNEPGFEKETGIRSINYNKILEYYNIKGATIKMINNPPVICDIFSETMEKHFLKNILFYKSYIDRNKINNNKPIVSTIYSLNANLNITKLEEDILALYERLSSKYNKGNNVDGNSAVNSGGESTINSVEISTESTDSLIIKKKPKKYVRKCPNDPSKNFDVGFVKLSENDNKEYKVIQIDGPKRTMKKWVLIHH